MSASKYFECRPTVGYAVPVSVRVTCGSSPRSMPRWSLSAWKARKSEHWRPRTSMIWMYSPARTS